MIRKFLAEEYFERSLFFFWLTGALLLLAASWSNILSWRMGDADDYLRLVQVRDLVAGQGWWDVTQYRMNLPDGGPMHWSRLVDIPLALAILLLSPLLGQPLAEQVASATVPLLTYGTAIYFLAQAARRLFDHKVALLAAAATFALLPLINQLLPMRIDHHGWQLVAFSICLWALLEPARSTKSAIIIGLSLAAWTEISVEALPYVAAFMGLLCLRWLAAPAKATKLAQFPTAMLSLAISGFIMLAAMEGPKFTVNFCDSFSLFHALSFAAAAAIVTIGALAAGRFDGPMKLAFKLAFCMVAGVSGIGVVLFAAPQCAGDAFGNLDPLVRQYWYNFVPEGMPLWQVQPQFAAQPLAAMAIFTIGIVWFLAKSKTQALSVRIEIVLLYLACLIVGLLVQRAAIYALAIGVIIASALAIEIFRASDQKEAFVPRIAMKLLACALLVPSILGQYAYDSFKASAAASDLQNNAQEENFRELAKECHSHETIGKLNSLPKARLMLGLDVSPSMLLLTHHTVVATGHHRNQAAMKDVIQAFTLPPGDALPIFRQRKIEYLLICPGSFELYRYEKTAPGGLLASLRAGDSPDWLSRQTDIGPYKIWRFVGDSSNAR